MLARFLQGYVSLYSNISTKPFCWIHRLHIAIMAKYQRLKSDAGVLLRADSCNLKSGGMVIYKIYVGSFAANLHQSGESISYMRLDPAAISAVQVRLNEDH